MCLVCLRLREYVRSCVPASLHECACISLLSPQYVCVTPSALLSVKCRVLLRRGMSVTVWKRLLMELP